MSCTESLRLEPASEPDSVEKGACGKRRYAISCNTDIIIIQQVCQPCDPVQYTPWQANEIAVSETDLGPDSPIPGDDIRRVQPCDGGCLGGRSEKHRQPA